MPRADGLPRHRRTYRACLPCRTAKLKCDLGAVDAPLDPPCRRCRRTGRTCAFGESSYRHTPVLGDVPAVAATAAAAGPSSPSLPLPASTAALDAAARARTEPPVPSSGPPPRPHQQDTSPHTVVALSDAMSTPTPAAGGGGGGGGGGVRDAPRFDLVYGQNLETPADALRLLCSVADDNRPAEPHRVPLAPGGGDVWNHWAPIREGLLTSAEATTLLSFFAANISPTHPVAPAQLLERENLPLLLSEPVLVGALTCVAARYCDLGQSFDPREPSRSRVVQARLVEWLLKRLAHLTMGSSALRTIGTVEALLILAEWPPRSMLLEDASFPDETSEKGVRACKQQDDVAWTLVGLELALHDEVTYMAENYSSWAAMRRLNTWIYSGWRVVKVKG